jgi:uridine phosphorylase
MSELFDTVELRTSNREFVAHTGTYNNRKVSVLSTGIGTDNIEIVVNELDALANIDFKTRQSRPEHTSLKLVRVGTSGALQPDITPGDTVLSVISGGLDNVMHFYNDAPSIFDHPMGEAFHRHMNWNLSNSHPYFIHASEELVAKFKKMPCHSDITLSAPGFYAPQGRALRFSGMNDNYLKQLEEFRFSGLRIANFEMEGSALYGISKILGHEALTICAVLANRITGKFISDYQAIVEQLLQEVLDRTTSDE